MAGQSQVRKRPSLATQELPAVQDRGEAKSAVSTRPAQQIRLTSLAALGAKPKAKAVRQEAVSGQRDVVLAAEVAGRTVAAKRSMNSNEGSRRVKSKFTEEEDRAMRQWVAERPKFPDQGKKIWEAAEKAKVTSHSWQSMQNHWRRSLRKRATGDAEAQLRAS